MLQAPSHVRVMRHVSQPTLQVNGDAAGAPSAESGACMGFLSRPRHVRMHVLA